LKHVAAREQDGSREGEMSERYQTFQDFWPFYLSQHMNATTRALHFAGTAIVCACLLAAHFVSGLWLALAPVAGYGFAWVGHFFFERNRPATFTYPLWSLRGDFRMFRLMLTGRMGPELERAARLFPIGASGATSI
jgi:hypothetical protein